MHLDEFLALIESKTGYRPKLSGNGYAGRCPCSAHDDKRPSLSIASGEDGRILLYCHAGCSFDAICQELGMVPSQLFHKEKHTIAANQFYYYHNENGEVLYRKVKTPKKSFYFERFENGNWLRGLGNSRRVLYNLPEVVDAIQEGRQIAVVEGEKDVETMREQGYVATTNDSGGGKNKWNKSHSEALKNADVLLFFDYDNTGIEHRDNVINQLQRYVKSIKLVNLPGYEVSAKNGKDVTDWLKEGHLSSELKKIIEEAPVITGAVNASPDNLSNDIIRAVSIEALLKMNIDPPEIFLGPFITKASLGMIYAPRGLGKTFFALGIALAVSSGSEFLKFYSPKPCKVVYLDGEMSIHTMKERIEKIYNSQEVKPPEGFFKIVNPFLQDIPLPDLGTVRGQQMLESIVADADVIIVDNLSCWMTGGKENEGESWMPVLEWALRMRRQGKAVIFIHHANKNNNQRGTSRREDALDYVIKLDKPPNYKPEEGACFVMSFEKHRSWYGSDVESLRVKLIDQPDGNLSWEWSVANVEGDEDFIVTKMKRLQDEGKTQREIGKEVGMSASSVCRKMKNS